MNQDFVDLLRAFNNADVRFLIPGRVDILTDLTGLAFDEAWPHRLARPFDDVTVNVIGLAEFVRKKQAAGRAKDLADIDGL